MYAHGVDGIPDEMIFFRREGRRLDLIQKDQKR
jgi:hypothetical protein